MGFFENRYHRICPDFTADIQVRPALRVNTLRIDPCALVKRLEKRKVELEKVPFLNAGYYYQALFSLGATPEYLLGHYYLQGVAPQLVAELLAPEPDEQILDMAAAPGGKTTHLAQIMQNKGVIFALDANAHRLAALRNNCERLMVRNVLMLRKDARFAVDLKEVFDRVLLDAPCSGNFCSDPGWFAKRRIEDVRQNARVQKELLKAAATVVKPGGLILYSTCSLEPEEDEFVIDWAVKKFGLTVEPLDLPLGDPGLLEWAGRTLDPSLTNTRRFWPHRAGTEGFFIAKLRRT